MLPSADDHEPAGRLGGQCDSSKGAQAYRGYSRKQRGNEVISWLYGKKHERGRVLRQGNRPAQIKILSAKKWHHVCEMCLVLRKQNVMNKRIKKTIRARARSSAAPRVYRPLPPSSRPPSRPSYRGRTSGRPVASRRKCRKGLRAINSTQTL